MSNEFTVDAALLRPFAPPPRLLMGPGPITVDPRVLRAMSAQLVGQYDPAMTQCMNDTMALYRAVFKTNNRWTLLVDGTSRAGIEAVLVSLVEPGDKILVPIFGRFGHLLCEIAERAGAEVHRIERPWGEVFTTEEIEQAIRQVQPKVLAIVQGDTSTTLLQPLEHLGAICARYGVLFYSDATASIGGNPFETDAWQLDAVSVGLQKCLGGPSGSAPLTLSEKAVERIRQRRHVEAGIRTAQHQVGSGRRIASNYFDLGMIMDYWGEERLNHHTEATTMLYGARECARILLEEGVDQSIERHRLHGRAMAESLAAMNLQLFGDQRYKMHNVVGVYIPDGIAGEAVRSSMLNDFGIEIGTSFGPLHGKIWRIGTMGYNARKDAVLQTLAALEAVLRRAGHAMSANAGVDRALAVYAETADIR
ncbi:pyridoxal-phosphate-dependent aminotransferase family protein [Cellvibrio japonicus]|uniref:Purine catabolism protein n=1 Tax=Cellvibrio japonicus (strain Ueda107) TaxID=498211 RepID=B3PJH2_CELJU|nr:alanine--glyoxylate aminotransferase family protein [Cellvibrio japonicus]ACE86302.1 purine catabolism protein [Cellvibrio japonicus Ueda107]QEI11262.1 alanine--glyoxylate aminotransferase family protein [Cellvibrio japonicus]QEI14836.1 alanine--glyoxylate aminotransferase family protein [Cellvibrio japonicus]QEI18416.1 alanine--glyoxylate aminotransferase family protein [Cellvibrio japonicus]